MFYFRETASLLPLKALFIENPPSHISDMSSVFAANLIKTNKHFAAKSFYIVSDMAAAAVCGGNAVKGFKNR